MALYWNVVHSHGHYHLESCNQLTLDMKQLVEQYIQYYNTFQIEKMLDLFTDDCIFQNVSNSSGITECKGKTELRTLAEQGTRIFQERKQTVTNWIISDNKIAIEIDYEATFAKGHPHEGVHIKLKGVSIFEFRSGKIHRLVDFS